MKKIVLVVFMCLLTISLVGCGKEKEKDSNIEISLYSDKTKIVYDVGLYKAVYYYKGNEITGVKHYYEYDTKEKATEKLISDKKELVNNTSIKSITQEDKYVIYTMSDDYYKDSTVEQIRTDYSYLTEMIK